MLETEQNPEVQTYLKAELKQLEQVMGNLSRRKSTLLRYGEVIARRQEEFFRGGPLIKLTHRDLAEELALHESTVSRAVAKYRMELRVPPASGRKRKNAV